MAASNPTPPVATSGIYKNLFARGLDLVTLCVCGYLIILGSTHIPAPESGVKPFDYASIYILLIVTMLTVRCVIGLLSYDGDYDLIDLMLMSTVVVGPAIIAGAYTLSKDKDLRDLLSGIGTTILGVGTGAMANNSKAAFPKRRRP